MARVSVERTVPRSWVDGYADSLEMISTAMKKRLAADLAKVDYTAPVAQVREMLIAIMQTYCYESRAQAAQAAAEFYDGLRERMVGERMGALPYDGYNPEAVERRVRSAVEPLAEAQRAEGMAERLPGVAVPEGEHWADGIGHELERESTRRASEEIARALAEYIGWSIKEAAGGTVYSNGEHDSRRVKYARIPRGSKSYPGGCPFCQMLASRGFAYLSELSAGKADPNHYHDDCQCMVVPSWGRGSVEGYDKHAYDSGYQEWLDQDHSRHEANARATQRNRYDARGRLKNGTGERVDRKRSLTTDNQDAGANRSESAKGNTLLTSHQKTVSDFSREISRRIGLFEQNKTDEAYDRLIRSYLRSLSTEGRIDARFGAKPKGKEVASVVRLAEEGHTVVFLPETEENGVKNIDILMDNELWELKVPDPPKARQNESSDPLRYIENNLKKAKKQFNSPHYDETGTRLVKGGPIRVVFDSRCREGVDNEVEARLAQRKIDRGIDEILFIDHAGSLIPV